MEIIDETRRMLFYVEQGMSLITVYDIRTQCTNACVNVNSAPPQANPRNSDRKGLSIV